VTKQSLLLEKLFCRIGSINLTTTITQGNSSVTVAQIISNIACNLLGNVVSRLLFVGTFMWFKLRLVVASGALVAAG
jgi:formate/nitrite transporter FocA (FNT family)